FKYRKPEIDKKLLKKHLRGEHADEKGVKTKFFKEKLKRKEVYLEYAAEQAARAEILKNEEEGFIEADQDESTADYTQKEIVQNVDITAATKHFNLSLDFGPYRLRYTKNGRHLLLGGRRGHIAAFDWVTKRIHCEMNVMEEVADVSWLHLETMFACAQKNWVYFYDNQGTEIHCIKRMSRVNRMEFLPYHFLLATASSEGFLSWLDVSIGEIVAQYNSKAGDIRIMCQNPYNAVLCTGGSKGVVSMWSPTVREPLAKVLVHSTPMTAIAVDPKGMHLATGGLDRSLKVWDIRKLSGPLAVYKCGMAVNEIDISQKGVLAFSTGNICEMYKQTVMESENPSPYLRERVNDYVYGLRFCPYEDVLGVSTGKGFTSLLVPGSGEPNFDGLEANPFQTKKQRREHEVHALLEKIPMDLISLEPNEIRGVDVETLQDKVNAKKSILFVKPPRIDFKSRRKMKGKGGSANAAKNKQIVKDAKRKEFIKDAKKARDKVFEQHKEKSTTEDFIPLESSNATVLDRFKENIQMQNYCRILISQQLTL
ncbi:WD repeat-containing protein 46, partial [Hermetia illucens]|uniref:WD repeat-containing protein 46 n=1 Tax=Hermetia illucens TaxID=343691 RepID=UPI0018CC36A9